MTGLERQMITNAIKSMYYLTTSKPDFQNFAEDMLKKTDYQLVCIFQSYVSNLKKLGIERPKESLLIQPLYGEVSRLLENNGVSLHKIINQKAIHDEEDLDVLYFLEGQCFADFYCGYAPRLIAFFDPDKLERASSEELLDILAICSHYQVAKIYAEEKTKEDLGLPNSAKLKIKKWMQKVREIFPCTSDYYAILRSNPEILKWNSKPIEECFEDLIEILEPFLYELNVDERRYLKREFRKSGE